MYRSADRFCSRVPHEHLIPNFNTQHGSRLQHVQVFRYSMQGRFKTECLSGFAARCQARRGYTTARSKAACKASPEQELAPLLCTNLPLELSLSIGKNDAKRQETSSHHQEPPIYIFSHALTCFVSNATISRLLSDSQHPGKPFECSTDRSAQCEIPCHTSHKACHHIHIHIHTVAIHPHRHHHHRLTFTHADLPTIGLEPSDPMETFTAFA